MMGNIDKIHVDVALQPVDSMMIKMETL